MSESVIVPNVENTLLKTRLTSLAREANLVVHVDETLAFSLLYSLAGPSGRVAQVIRLTDQQAEILIRLEHAPAR